MSCELGETLLVKLRSKWYRKQKGNVFSKKSLKLRATKNDLQDWLEKQVGVTNDAVAKSDLGRLFAVTKKLRSGHDRLRKPIRDENGVLHVD